MDRFFLQIVMSCLLIGLQGCSINKSRKKKALNKTPELVDNWWQIAGVPNIGQYNNAAMEPVDFAIWQAADGTWQLVSCIRKCGSDGDFRLLHRWEGKNLNDTFWEPKGIFMKADSTLGEQFGWIQAPYVVKKDGIFNMFYGGGAQICLAQSTDGKTFTKHIQSNCKTKIFGCDLYGRARDIMIMQHNNTNYGYYTGSMTTSWPNDTKGAVFCRISDDLITWGDEIKVSETNENVMPYFSSECPQVIHQDGQFYLFKTQEYLPGSQQTTIYRSANPLDFGINSQRYKIKTIPISAPEVIFYNNDYYIAALMPDLKGIRITKLNWK